MGRTRVLGGAGIAASMFLCSGLVAVVAPGIASAASASVTCAPVTGTPVSHPPRDSYMPITPQRLVDTRDGTGGVTGEVGAGCTLVLDLTDSPVPDDAEAVALSVTAIAPQRGFVTVFACDEGQPPTSNLNTRAGFPTPNLVAAAIDSDHRVCLYSLFNTHLVVDLAGWWSDGPDRYSPVAPARAYDTRQLPGGARLPPGEVRAIPLAGEFVAEDATAAMLNLTVIEGASPGFLVAFPCGTPAPLASNLNFMTGEARAVAAIVGLGPSGDVCVMSNVDVHVIVDVTGAYAPAPSFGPAPSLHPLVGHRVADTRTPDDPWTAPFAAGETRRLDPLAGTTFAGHGGAVVLNVVATNITRPGFVTMYPCGGTTPLVSSLNLMPGGEATNLVPVELGPTGEVCVLASQATDLVVDLFGVMGPADNSLAERLAFPGRTVFPDYSPNGTDYAVVCDAGPTQLTIDVDPLPNVAVTVNGAGRPAGEIELTVPEEGLTTVSLSNGIDSDTHHFRCVPPDFPVLDVTRTGDTAPGWYFTTLSQGIPLAPFLVILDERGAPVWYKRADQDTLDFKRLANGEFAYTTALGPRFGIDTEHGYRITNLQGELLGEHLTADPEAFPVDHHDYIELPDGGWALLTYPLVQEEDLDVLDGVLGQQFHDDDSIVDGVIQEVNASGALEWQWRTMDHFEYAEVTFPQRFALYPDEPNGGEVDVWHLNSLHRVADGTEDYVVSARHLDAIFRVDRTTGEIDWILGGNADVDRPERLEIVGDPLDGPLRPHDARLNGDVLTLFDNRAGTTGPARAVAYRIDDDPGDMTATLLWEIREPGGRPSPGLGSVRAAGDGSVLVDWGALQPMFQEFDADGEPLMTIRYSGNPPYRIVKYPKSVLSAAQLRANAGGEAEAPA